MNLIYITEEMFDKELAPFYERSGCTTAHQFIDYQMQVWKERKDKFSYIMEHPEYEYWAWVLSVFHGAPLNSLDAVTSNNELIRKTAQRWTKDIRAKDAESN